MNFEPLDPMASIDATWNVDDLLTQHSQSLLLPDGRFDFFHSHKRTTVPRLSERNTTIGWTRKDTPRNGITPPQAALSLV